MSVPPRWPPFTLFQNLRCSTEGSFGRDLIPSTKILSFFSRFPEKLPNDPRDKIRCFGLNQHGQLGYGDTDARGQSPATMGDSLAPVDLGAGAVVIDMAAGSDHTCVVLEGGDVKVGGVGFVCAAASINKTSLPPFTIEPPGHVSKRAHFCEPRWVSCAHRILKFAGVAAVLTFRGLPRGAPAALSLPTLPLSIYICINTESSGCTQIDTGSK